MYAIVETGGKQVKVSVGEAIFVEKLDVEEGSTYTFDKVLLVSLSFSCSLVNSLIFLFLSTTILFNNSIPSKSFEINLLLWVLFLISSFVILI